MYWSSEEEQLLKELKEERGIKSWKKIAAVIHESGSGYFRIGKQYRDRYVNYIRFNGAGSKIAGWTQQEEAEFLTNYFRIGAKWVEMSHLMQGRSENGLKNKFYGLVRKVSRALQKYLRTLKPKPKKLIEQKYVIRALDQCRRMGQVQSTNTRDFSHQAAQLQQRLTKLILRVGEGTPHADIAETASIITKLNPSKSPSHKKSAALSSKSASKAETLTNGYSSPCPQKQISSHKYATDTTLLESMEVESGVGLAKTYMCGFGRAQEQDLMEDFYAILDIESTPACSTFSI